MTVAAVLGFVTLAVSYRRHNGSLIKVIRRDGGMYYLSAFCTSTISLDEAPFNSYTDNVMLS
jgi:hypothetical protein